MFIKLNSFETIAFLETVPQFLTILSSTSSANMAWCGLGDDSFFLIAVTAYFGLKVEIDSISGVIDKHESCPKVR